MSLADVLPEVQSLSRLDKIRLIQLLARQLEQDDTDLIEPGKAYPVWSPDTAFTAAAALGRSVAAPAHAGARRVAQTWSNLQNDQDGRAVRLYTSRVMWRSVRWKCGNSRRQPPCGHRSGYATQDLKLGAFTHADAGQMNLYLNYAREHLTETGENTPVGIILCSEKDDTVVEYAMGGINARVFAAQYLTRLPPAAELRAVIERTLAWSASSLFRSAGCGSRALNGGRRLRDFASSGVPGISMAVNDCTGSTPS